MTLHTRMATLAPFDLYEFHEWFNRECLEVDHATVNIKDGSSGSTISRS